MHSLSLTTERGETVSLNWSFWLMMHDPERSQLGKLACACSIIILSGIVIGIL